MGTGIWANFHWESGIWSLGMGITDRKTIELGLGFLKFGKTIGWEMGFGQKNLGWENGIYTPPPFRTLLVRSTPERVSQPRCINGHQRIYSWGVTQRWTSIPSRGEKKKS